MKNYKNIIEAAQGRGSTAKTKSGAWKFLLKNLTPPPEERASGRAVWDIYRAARIQRAAAGRAAVLGYPDANQDWINYCGAYEENFSRAAAVEKMTRVAELGARDINDCLRGYSYGYAVKITLGAQTLLLQRVENTTWGERGHWPESSTVSYVATLYTRSGAQLGRCDFSRRGDWLGEVAQKLGLPATKKNKISLSGVDIITGTRQIGDLAIHTLQIFGVGAKKYCAVYRGITYHADTRSAAVGGLKQKINASIDVSAKKIITLADVLALGFCQSGVRSFLAAVDLPPDTQRISRVRLSEIVATHDCARYAAELTRVGISIND